MNYKQRMRSLDQDKEFVEVERKISLYATRTWEERLLKLLLGYFSEEFPQRALPIVEEYPLPQGRTIRIKLEPLVDTSSIQTRRSHGNKG